MTSGRAGRQAVQYLEADQRAVFAALNPVQPVPGCIVESIIFFALHSSGVMSRIFPVLYAVTSCFACSRPAEDVSRVLVCQKSALVLQLRRVGKPDAKANGSGTHHT